jgi:hypothetical protein
MRVSLINSNPKDPESSIYEEYGFPHPVEVSGEI